MRITRRVGLLAAGATAAVCSWTAPALAQDSPPPSVLGVEVTRPAPAQLPRTGGDLGPEVIAGVGLTAVGVALVVGARKRRQPTSA